MKLDQYLREHSVTARSFARATGFDVSQISRWASGERTPSIEQAAKIKEASNGNVTFEDFLTSQAAD